MVVHNDASSRGGAGERTVDVGTIVEGSHSSTSRDGIRMSNQSEPIWKTLVLLLPRFVFHYAHWFGELCIGLLDQDIQRLNRAKQALERAVGVPQQPAQQDDPESDKQDVPVTCPDCGETSIFLGSLEGTVQECSHCAAFVDVASAALHQDSA